MSLKLAIVGVGNMGEAFAVAFLARELASPENIFLLDKHKEKLESFRAKGLQLLSSVSELPADLDALILAVKPQDVTKLKSDLQIFFQTRKDTLLVSIMAGASLVSLAEISGAKYVLRAMPNLPARLGKGMTCFCLSPSCTDLHRSMSAQLLGAVGEVLEVKEEGLLDAATAVAGSGPGFVYEFMIAFEKAAEAFAFSPDEARLLVRQTFLGALALLEQSGENAEDLQEKVRSKKGTTDAGLIGFEKRNLRQIVAESLDDARKRSVELGAEISKSLK